MSLLQYELVFTLTLREMRVLERFCSFEVCLSTLFDAKQGPLKTSVSRKAVRLDNMSFVNFIVAWNGLAKSTKLLNLFQMIANFVKARKVVVVSLYMPYR